MEYNIHSLRQNTQNLSTSNVHPVKNPEQNEETKNLSIPTQGDVHLELTNEIKEKIFSDDVLDSYALNPNMLNHSEISEFHRAKMRLWIAQNCHIRKLSARTSSLACYILDLYFLNKNKCSLEQFHEFGICCLRIANKLDDNIYIPINYEVFSREKLIQIQSQICLKVNFFLTPLTFTEITHALNYIWSQFKNKLLQDPQLELFKSLSFEQKSFILQTDYAIILLNEFLQLVYLILESFKYRLDVISFNGFCLILCLQNEFLRNTSQLPKIPISLKKNENSLKIINSFTNFSKECNYSLSLDVKDEIIKYLNPIFNLLISEQEEDKQAKSNSFEFNPNHLCFSSEQKQGVQSCIFKNKLKSFKKYVKGRRLPKMRKCSEMTTL